MSVERWITPLTLLFLLAINPMAQAEENRAALEDSSAITEPTVTSPAAEVATTPRSLDEDDDKPKAKAKKKGKAKEEMEDDDDEDEDGDDDDEDEEKA